MKNIYLKIKNSLKVSILGLMGLLLAFQACSDANENVIPFATPKDMLITEYLEADPDQYSEFLILMKSCRLDKLLNGYGNYTCFIPNNEAVRAYYKDKDISSANDLTAEEIKGLVYNHIIDCGESKALEWFDLLDGQIAQYTLGGSNLNIKIDATSQIFVGVDEFALIKESMLLQNGVVHTIDKVAEVSTKKLADLLIENPQFSLFNDALVATGLTDSLRISQNDEYERLKEQNIIPEAIPTLISYDKSALRKTPSHCYYGYTILAESNETLLKDANIRNLDDLKAYAKRVYDGLYPDDVDVKDFKDPRNSLNRYVRYHILDRDLPANELVPSFWTQFFAKGAVLTDYAETLSHCLIEIKKTSSGILFNQKRDGTAVALKEQSEGAKTTAVHSSLHEIDHILTYENVESDVLYKRLRMDISTLNPEMATNKLRGKYLESGYGIMIIPQNYFKNLTYSASSQLHLYGSRGDYNFLGDEFLCVGKYDLTLRLPPVPKGTYEIRVGFSANKERAVSQVYLDGEPCGIPVDMKIRPDNPALNEAYLGWIADGADEAVNRENDKAMRNRGYMKGPNSVLIPSSGDVLRISNALRKIITTASLSKGDHFLRIKSVEDNTQAQMMIDYIELVPISLIDTEDIN